MGGYRHSPWLSNKNICCACKNDLQGSLLPRHTEEFQKSHDLFLRELQNHPKGGRSRRGVVHTEDPLHPQCCLGSGLHSGFCSMLSSQPPLS